MGADWEQKRSRVGAEGELIGSRRGADCEQIRSRLGESGNRLGVDEELIGSIGIRWGLTGSRRGAE